MRMSVANLISRVISTIRLLEISDYFALNLRGTSTICHVYKTCALLYLLQSIYNMAKMISPSNGPITTTLTMACSESHSLALTYVPLGYVSVAHQKQLD
jgi:hypothetical protein